MKKCDKLNLFCYVCGQYTPISHRQGAHSDDLKTAYMHYFNGKVMAFESWAPSTVCKTCYNSLLEWKANKRERMAFGTPMEWMDYFGPHQEESCYACANHRPVMNRQQMKGKYVGALNVILPLPHSEHIPVPKYPSPDILSACAPSIDAPTIEYTEASDAYSLFEPPPSALKQPILITQDQLDLIVTKLELSQGKSELLASFLNSKYLLAPGTKVTAYRKRQSAYQNLFVVNDEKDFAYCDDVETLMAAMDIKYDANDWRLFIDSSSSSLKAVLLHKTNKKPSIPVAYSTETSETYEAMENILKCIKYEEHQWRICCDLKVVAILCGLEAGYVKRMCFMCDWDTRKPKHEQYDDHSWKPREESEFEKWNIYRDPLVPKENIMLPPLHIKLGIVQNFIKAVIKREAVFECLKGIFPRLSEAKLLGGKTCL